MSKTPPGSDGITTTISLKEWMDMMTALQESVKLQSHASEWVLRLRDLREAQEEPDNQQGPT